MVRRQPGQYQDQHETAQHDGDVVDDILGQALVKDRVGVNLHDRGELAGLANEDRVFADDAVLAGSVADADVDHVVVGRKHIVVDLERNAEIVVFAGIRIADQQHFVDRVVNQRHVRADAEILELGFDRTGV